MQGRGALPRIWQGAGLAFPTWFSERAGPLQRLLPDTLQRQVGAT